MGRVLPRPKHRARPLNLIVRTHVEAGHVAEFVIRWGVPIVGVLSGVICYVVAKSQPSRTNRVLVSAYGPVIAAMWVALVWLLPPDYRYRDHLPQFWSLLIIPIALMVYSVIRARGNRWVHLLVPVNLAAVGLLFIIGSIAVAGK